MERIISILGYKLCARLGKINGKFWGNKMNASIAKISVKFCDTN